MWLTKNSLGLVYMHPKMDRNKHIQIEKLKNNDRWIFEISNHSGSKRILTKMMDTSHDCFIQNGVYYSISQSQNRFLTIFWMVGIWRFAVRITKNDRDNSEINIFRFLIRFWGINLHNKASSSRQFKFLARRLRSSNVKFLRFLFLALNSKLVLFRHQILLFSSCTKSWSRKWGPKSTRECT